MEHLIFEGVLKITPNTYTLGHTKALPHNQPPQPVSPLSKAYSHKQYSMKLSYYRREPYLTKPPKRTNI